MLPWFYCDRCLTALPPGTADQPSGAVISKCQKVMCQACWTKTNKCFSCTTRCQTVLLERAPEVIQSLFSESNEDELKSFYKIDHFQTLQKTALVSHLHTSMRDLKETLRIKREMRLEKEANHKRKCHELGEWTRRENFLTKQMVTLRRAGGNPYQAGRQVPPCERNYI